MKLDHVQQLASTIAAKQHSNRTRADYARAFAMLDDAGLTPQKYAEQCASKDTPVSKSRYYVLKGAYQHGLSVRIVGNLNTIRALQAHDQTAADDQIAHLKQILSYDCERLCDQKADYSRSRYRKNTAAAHHVSVNSKPRKNKRQYLGLLNRAYPDWQKRIYEAIAPQHRPLLATLAATGCRPDEFAKGVELCTKDGQLVVTVKGSKTNTGYGQKIRVMTFEPSSSIERNLFALAQKNGGRIMVSPAASARAVRESFQNAVATALGPTWTGKVSQYSLRQQFAADLKGSHLDPELIALALGHCSERTQGHYGLARQQQKGATRGLLQVQGSQQVNMRSRPSLTQTFMD